MHRMRFVERLVRKKRFWAVVGFSVVYRSSVKTSSCASKTLWSPPARLSKHASSCSMQTLPAKCTTGSYEWISLYPTENGARFLRGIELRHSGVHVGSRPGVHGAPAASAFFSSVARSVDTSERSLSNTSANCDEAISYARRCVSVGAAVHVQWP